MHKLAPITDKKYRKTGYRSRDEIRWAQRPYRHHIKRMLQKVDHEEVSIPTR